MEAPGALKFREGGSADAAALSSVLAKANETYADWTPADWDPQIELSAQESDRLAPVLANPGSWCLIAEDDSQRAVAYVVLRPAVTSGEERERESIPGLAHLWHLFVRPAWWGSGVAARLLAEAMAEAERRRYRAARLWTPRDHSRARAFYRREGWRETGEEHYAADLDLPLVEYRRPLGGDMLAT
ncbi:MAG TPA: GNAT family N-acetyltransferase [Thermoleophilaceae bacterium]|jgi:GNAT superfamily N-acetyltransferase